jgi:hypothetical protein
MNYVSWLVPFVADLSPRRHGFDPELILMRFVVNKATLEQLFLRVLRFSPVNAMPPVPQNELHLHATLTRRTSGENPNA